MNQDDSDDIKAQVKKQNDEVYGEETVSGSSPDPDSDSDTAANLSDAIGNEPDKNDKGFELAKEVHDDELARRGAKDPSD